MGEVELGQAAQAAMAGRISSYDAQWVPGLFQNPDDTRALIRSGGRRLTEEQIDAQVEPRMARRDLRRRPGDVRDCRLL